MTDATPATRTVWVTLAAISYINAQPHEPSVSCEDIERALAKHRDTIGPWRLHWFGLSSDQANLVFVVKSLDKDTWAVVVRGSLMNPLNKGFWTDWALEDLQVLQQSSLPFEFGASGAKVAAGMQLAWNHVESMSWKGRGLRDFLLDELVRGRDDLWFIGHSLGGAMVPMLAAWFERIAQKSGERRTDWITPISFGGPTTGNPAFANAVAERFGGFRYRFFNTQDMVTHTWTHHGLRWIMSSYHVRPRIPRWFWAVCWAVRGWMVLKRVRYAQPGEGTALPGTVAENDEWFAEVEHQHSIAVYVQLLHGPDVLGMQADSRATHQDANTETK